MAVDILNTIPGMRCFRPEATFYLFPNVTGAMRRLGLLDYTRFRQTVLRETGVSFCTRAHFGRVAPRGKGVLHPTGVLGNRCAADP